MRAIRWIPRTTFLGLALLAAACGGGDHNPAGPGGGLTGTWTLVGINEDGLPRASRTTSARPTSRAARSG